jgi:FixJ family two-component response regulator
MTGAEKRRVAIADDDVRDSLRFLPDVAGHFVETFASAAEFLRAEMKNLVFLIL